MVRFFYFSMRNFFKSIQWRDHLINFIVVVVGVTLAFYLSNRKASSDQRALELSSLRSIVSDLESDIADLKGSTDTLKVMKDQLEQAVNTIMSGQSLENPGQSIGVLYVQLPFIPNDNTYQSLLTSGKLDVIEDFEIRKQITDLYHSHYQTIKIIDELSSAQKNTLVFPYLMNVNPLDLKSVDVKEPAFINANLFTLYYLTQKLDYDKKALEKAIALKGSIERKLNEE